MHPTASDRSRWLGAATLVAIALGGTAFTRLATAQSRDAQATRILSSEIAISREQAELKLELSNGRKLTLSTLANNTRGVQRSGVAGTPGDVMQTLALGVRRGDALDRSWRELLNQAMDTPTDELAPLLIKWAAPEGGAQLDDLLESALAGAPMPALAPDAPINNELGDSLNKLQERIQQLESELDDRHVEVEAVDEWRRERNRGPDWFSPLRHVGRGISDILSTLVMFAVLFGLGFAVIFFGGRKHLEEVAEAVRHATFRSFLVGIAAAFLVVPVFVLGMVVLAVSIVGIPALLVWLPAFPLAVVLSCILGYLAVAHAAGEAMAERRFYGGDWFSRANSYYYLITGLGLLLALFLAAHVIQLLGPWLGFIHGILMFLGVVLSWAALTTGFGAVLITRAGSRPIRPAPAPEPELFDADTANI
jgi:hypothetical protein